MVMITNDPYSAVRLRTRDFIKSGDYKSAEEVYNDIIKSDPKNDWPYLWRAMFYTQIGWLEKAIVAYTEIIEKRPDGIDNYVSRAEVYKKLNRPTEVAADVNKAVEFILNGKLCSLATSSSVADLCYELGKIDVAVSVLTKAIELSPTDYRYYFRAEFYKKIGKVNLALTDYNKAVELSPLDPIPAWGRAELYEQIGEIDKALSEYTDIIKSYQDDFSYCYRAEFYERQGKNEEAIVDYNKAIEVEPDSSYAYWCRGEFYERHGKIKEARVDYNKAEMIRDD